jgi:hypothetical protein
LRTKKACIDDADLKLSTNPRKGYPFKYVSGVIPCGQQIGVAYELSQLTRLQPDQNRRFCALPGESCPFVRQRLGSEANLLNRWPDRILLLCLSSEACINDADLELSTKGAEDYLHRPLVDSAKACLPLSCPEQNVRFFPDASRKLSESASFQDAGLKIAHTLSLKAAHALYLTNVDLRK